MGRLVAASAIAERVLAEATAPPRPRRIACLTEETVEILYRIGAGDLVVGVSKYVRRPPEAMSKPQVSAFVRADYAAVEALHPDLVLCFSDLQADIAAECARRGMAVVLFNQRSVAEILGVVLMVGSLVGREAAARDLAAALEAHLRSVAARAGALPRRPRVHFEEWDDPLITGIRWVAELVEVAGGDYLFPEASLAHDATRRIVAPEEVVRRDPEVVLASWCGKSVRFEAIRARPGWDAVTAVREGRLHEVDPALILQPGPAALTDGLDVLHAAIADAVTTR
ncbi:MAG TPA: ABC transporter substrate-binding protein [Planctomycetota bacterium]|jgi:iron complex transport system substrate-binding protein|nr:ABC transporter substrate-binding protein [Planctomycetota bacterium]